MKQKNLKGEDMFRIMDIEFDENITISNMRQFLKNELRVTPAELKEDAL